MTIKQELEDIAVEIAKVNETALEGRELKVHLDDRRIYRVETVGPEGESKFIPWYMQDIEKADVEKVYYERKIPRGMTEEEKARLAEIEKRISDLESREVSVTFSGGFIKSHRDLVNDLVGSLKERAPSTENQSKGWGALDQRLVRLEATIGELKQRLDAMLRRAGWVE